MFLNLANPASFRLVLVKLFVWEDLYLLALQEISLTYYTLMLVLSNPVLPSLLIADLRFHRKSLLKLLSL